MGDAISNFTEELITPASDDLVAVVDTSTSKTKKQTHDNFHSNLKRLRFNPTILTFNAALDINFNTEQKQKLTLTGIATLTMLNRADGGSKTLYIVADSVDRVLTLPSGMHRVGGADTTSLTITANKRGVLTFDIVGGSADSDIWWAYAEKT